VTSQRDQLQALINRIDDLLNRADSRSGMGLPDGGAERQVLAQTREYLGRLAQQMAVGQSLPQPDNGYSALAAQEQSWQAPAPQMAETAQQVLQAIVQEMSFLRTNMMQPLREEVVQLQQERHLLTTEIQRLQQERQQLAESPQLNQQKMIQEFLQTLMGRLQEQLAGQVARAIANLEAQAAQAYPLAGAPDAQQLQGQPSDLPRLTPVERLKHLQLLQAQSDDLLLRLDSTLKVVFESLQTNIESYQDSLGQGLEKMHGLGQQGETMFTALVNRLANQLGREASFYLKSPLPTEWELPGLESTEQGAEMLLSGPPTEQGATEEASQATEIQDEIPSDQVNRILGATPSTPATPEAEDPADNPLINDLLNDLDADLANLNQESDLDLDLGLDDLDLDTASVDFPDAAINDGAVADGDVDDYTDDYADGDYADGEDAGGEYADGYVDDDEPTLLQVDENQIPALSQRHAPETNAPPAAVDAEADEALELLDRLATEMEDQLDESPWDAIDDLRSDWRDDPSADAMPSADPKTLDDSLLGDRPDHAPASSDASAPTDDASETSDEIDEFYAVFNAATGGDPVDYEDMDDTDAPQAELDADESLDGLFEDAPDDELFNPPEQADWGQIGNTEEVETIHSLADLVSDPAFSESAVVRSTSGDRRANELDDFVQASPDEDLLSAADVAINPSAALEFDETLMQQLSADLSGVEGLEGIASAEGDVENAAAEAGDAAENAAAENTLDAFGDELGGDVLDSPAADAPTPTVDDETDSGLATGGMTLDMFADRMGPPASLTEADAAASPSEASSGEMGLEDLFQTDAADEQPPPEEPEQSRGQFTPDSGPEQAAALRVADLFPTPSVPSDAAAGDRDMTLDDFGMAADVWHEPSDPSPAAEADAGQGEDTLTREGIAALFRDLPDADDSPSHPGETPEQTLADLLRNPNASVPGRDRPPGAAPSQTSGTEAHESSRDDDRDPFSMLFESRDANSQQGEDSEKKK